MKKMLSTMAQAICHPLLMPLVTVWMIFHFGGLFAMLPDALKTMVYVVLILFYGLIPLFLVSILRRWEVLRGDWEKETRSRVMPLIITAISFVFGNLILMRFPIPGVIGEALISSVFAVLFATIITWRWKISLYMLGLGWLTGTLISVAFQMRINPILWVGIGLLWSGSRGSLELEQGTQTPLQILAGYVLGFMCPVILISLF